MKQTIPETNTIDPRRSFAAEPTPLVNLDEDNLTTASALARACKYVGVNDGDKTLYVEFSLGYEDLSKKLAVFFRPYMANHNGLTQKPLTRTHYTIRCNTNNDLETVRKSLNALRNSINDILLAPTYTTKAEAAKQGYELLYFSNGLISLKIPYDAEKAKDANAAAHLENDTVNTQNDTVKTQLDTLKNSEEYNTTMNAIEKYNSFKWIWVAVGFVALVTILTILLIKKRKNSKK